MAWNNRIPRILHLYWGRNKPLSFMRWMTVKSFAVLNPEWQIKVYTPYEPIYDQPWQSGEQKTPTATYEDQFDRLADMEQIVMRNSMLVGCNSEVHRSDLWRWLVLAAEGGVWADFDILFIRPMATIELPDNIDVVVSYFKNRQGKDTNRIGFLMGADNPASDAFYGMVHKLAASKVDLTGYQSLGRAVLDQFIPGRESEFDAEFYNLPQPVVYPIQPKQLHRMYWTRSLELAASTVGIHWYAGHPDSQLQQAKITESNVAKQPASFFKLMTSMLRGAVAK